MKKYDLPRLSQLHTFEAVARHASFTMAAEELCLTQSAVSRQIKSLEQDVGQLLFSRKHRAIELTEDGQQLFRAVTRGLEEIVDCIDTIRAENGCDFLVAVYIFENMIIFGTFFRFNP